MTVAWRTVAVILALGMFSGCNKESSAVAPSVPKPAATASPSAPPPCVFDGHYRVRYSSNGHAGWWMRFDIADGKATMTEKTFVLFEKGPVETVVDEQRCTIVLSGASYFAGNIRVELGVDVESNRVTGVLTRTKAHNDEEKKVQVVGVRDVGAPKTPSCVAPGLYKVVFDANVPWVNKAEGDERECKDAGAYGSPFVLLVEPFGDALAVTIRKPEPPHGEAWATDKLLSRSRCAATVELSADQASLTARLQFDNSGIRGTATRSELQRVEEWDEGEEVWDCVGTDVPLVITKLP